MEQVGALVRKAPSGNIHEVLNGIDDQWNILERVALEGTFTMLNASSYSKSSLRRGTPDFELSLITLAK